MHPVDRGAGAAVISASAVLIAGVIIGLFHDLGPQARHMGMHILSMNVIAPLLAALVIARRQHYGSQPAHFWIVTLAQIAAVWMMHAPTIQAAAIDRPGLQFAIHGFLFLVALWFWTTLLSLPQARRWHAIPALLLSGKLVCLLAALLVFAPRTLYGTVQARGAAAHALDDQHLAGLLMIAACPLSYLVAAIIITVQLVSRVRDADTIALRPSQNPR